MNPNARISLSWNVMRFAYGAVIFLAGLDKLLGTDLIVYWPKYVSPFVAANLPLSIPAFLAVMGVIEIVVGLLFIFKWPRIAGYLTIVWLALIAINLLMLGYVDIAIRDLLLAVGAYAITELTMAVEALHLTRATD